MTRYQNAIRRITAGVFATGSSFVIGTASNLLLLPLYLRAWSTETYGEWMALSAVSYYLLHCDFGLTAATLNAATMAYARGDRAEFNRVRDTAWGISTTVSTAALLCVALGAYVLPIRDWLGFHSLSTADVRWMTVLLAGSFLLTMPTQQLRNAFAATGRFHIYQWLWNIGDVLGAVIAAVQLLARQSPVWVAAGVFASQALSMLVAAAALRLLDRSLLPHLSGVDRKLIPGLLKPSASFGISTLSTSFQLQLPVLLISRSLGGTAVALFTSARTICNLLKQIPMMFQLPLSRELSSLAGQKRKTELLHLHRVFMGITLLVAVTILSAIYTQGPWLVRIWSHGRLLVDSPMFRILAFGIFMEANIYAWGATALARNRNSGLAKIQLISSLMISALTALLLPRIKLMAAPVAILAVVVMIGAPLVLRDVVRRNELSWPWAWKHMVAPLALGTTVVLIVCSALQRCTGVPEIVMAALAIALSSALMSALIFTLVIDDADKLTIRNMFRRLLPA